MNDHHSRFQRLCHLAITALAVGLTRGLRANPTGLTVAGGSASAVAKGSVLNVTASSGALLNWQTFNINAGETTIFQQPSATSIVYNQITDQNPSQIWGGLQANGIVVLENKSGFYFGPNSVVTAPGFVAATAAAVPEDFGSGAFWQFNGPPPQASIINYGQINAGKSGSIFLIADKIENHGTITAPGGNIGLVSGQQVLISDRPDGRGLSAQVTLPSGSVDNTGRIIADAGTIALHARVVNQNGIIQADSVREQNGIIELTASDQINLGPNSQILARGDDSTASPGGSVTIQSGNSFSDSAGSAMVLTGGAQGGNGGNVEISAPNIQSLNSSMDASAQAGYAGGQLLLDPTEIVLGTTGTGSAGTGAVNAGDLPGTLSLNVNTAFLNKNFSQITLQASDNITFASGLSWNLSASTGLGAGTLTLEAGNNIIFGNSTSSAGPTISDTGNWSVNLEAGMNFSTGQVQPGIGSIFLNGGAGQNLSGAIQTAQGSITLTAGQDILVGSGYINTSQGGSIFADALAGSINAGTVKGGYTLDSTGYHVANGSPVGGISTVNGGDVTLEAGLNVISTPAVPTAAANQTPGASGAYGSQPGDVTVIAGNEILGSFLVRNGTGTLEAGVTVANGQVTQISNPAADIGSAASPVTLSLISGNWNAWAADDLFIAEVLNPNGIFNSNPVRVPAGVYPGNIGSTGVITAPPVRQAFLFDYAPDAGASFWAGDAITLGGSSPVRVSGGVPASQSIYPPQLSLTAGAGGITIANENVVLFPSAQGSLSITTHDGGNLEGTFLPNGRGLTGIIMSDSGLPDYQTFGGIAATAGHAVTPLHLADPNPRPVVLDISGAIETFLLNVPAAATIGAASILNFNFTGQNLTPLSVTSIKVTGDITYRGDLTTVTVTDPFPAGIFDPSLSGDLNATQNVIYNAAAGTLSFIGQMNSAQETFLLHPFVQVLDATSQPEFVNGLPVTAPVTLTAAQTTAIQQLFTASQTASLADAGGLNVNGPGSFNITARNLDLGISGGIKVNSENPFLPALSALSPLGASLTVNLSGNLEMSATEIMNGGLLGGINLQVGGKVDAGAQAGVFGDPNQARGIFTTSSGNVAVTATGDVNVDGSRIAAYDGGNVAVTSLQGDVNAGSGGSGAVNLDSVLQLGPGGSLEVFNSVTYPDGTVIKGIPMYGSGIMATTIGQSTVPVGNLTVSAPQGSINANVGGIEQLAFNNVTTPGGFIQLDAGNNINAGNSGVIGSSIRADAGGGVSGVFVGSGNVNINATGNFSGTVVGSTVVAVNAGGTISGTIVGGGSISVSGATIDANLVSGSVSASGNISAANVGVPASNVPKEDSKVAADASDTVAKTGGQNTDDDEIRKRAVKRPALAITTSRVTVILPRTP